MRPQNAKWRYAHSREEAGTVHITGYIELHKVRGALWGNVKSVEIHFFLLVTSTVLWTWLFNDCQRVCQRLYSYLWIRPSSLVWTKEGPLLIVPEDNKEPYGIRVFDYFILLRKTWTEGICFYYHSTFSSSFSQTLFSRAKIIHFCRDFYFIFGKTIFRLNKRKHFL